MMDRNRKKLLARLGHGRPVSRREMLAQGLEKSVAMMVLPSMYELLMAPHVARGEVNTVIAGMDCPINITSLACGIKVPYIQIDCCGGPQRLIEPKLEDGNYISAAGYAATQGEPSMPTFDTTFGAPMKAGGRQKALDGIKLVVNASTGAAKALTNTIAGAIWATTVDDKPDNLLSPLNIMSEIICAEFIPTTLGTWNTFLGGYHYGPIFNTGNRSLYVQDIDAVKDQFGFGPAIDSLDKCQQEAMLRAIQKLNSLELARLNSLKGSTDLCNTFNCSIEARIRAMDTFVGAQLDPRNIPALQNVFGISGTTPKNDWQAIKALVTYCALKRYATNSVIVISGCDYHYGHRATSDVKDLEIGRTIGEILATAAILNTPVMIGICNDGSVSSWGSNWTSDFYPHAGQFLFYFDPAGRPEYVRPMTQYNYYQVGKFVQSGTSAVIDQSTFVGNQSLGALRASWTFVLNFLRANLTETVSSPDFYLTRYRDYVSRTDVPDDPAGFIDSLCLFKQGPSSK